MPSHEWLDDKATGSIFNRIHQRLLVEVFSETNQQTMFSLDVF